MNLVYIIGKVVSDIDYKFTYKSNKNAVSIFVCELNNGSLIRVKAFDDKADYCYVNLKQGDFIIVEGKLSSKSNVNVKNIIDISKLSK